MDGLKSAATHVGVTVLAGGTKLMWDLYQITNRPGANQAVADGVKQASLGITQGVIDDSSCIPLNPNDPHDGKLFCITETLTTAASAGFEQIVELVASNLTSFYSTPSSDDSDTRLWVGLGLATGALLVVGGHTALKHYLAEGKRGYEVV
jgi:hypothetical protein